MRRFPQPQQMPIQQSPDRLYQRLASPDNGMGSEPGAASPNAHPIDLGDRWRGWTQIPAWYIVTVNLGGDDNAQAANSKTLRPEPFVLTRISFATTQDALPAAAGLPFTGGASNAGRSVTVLWQDEFTKFMGEDPCLVSAIFGDSNGFLDVPATLLLQGKQTLRVGLTRLFWPFDSELVPSQSTRWDFVYHGVALLPPGVQASGSAG